MSFVGKMWEILLANNLPIVSSVCTAPSEQATQPAEPQQPNTTVGDGSDGVAGGETSATGTAPGTSESMEREEEGRGGKKDGEKMEGEAEIEPATTESNVDKVYMYLLVPLK